MTKELQETFSAAGHLARVSEGIAAVCTPVSQAEYLRETGWILTGSYPSTPTSNGETGGMDVWQLVHVRSGVTEVYVFEDLATYYPVPDSETDSRSFSPRSIRRVLSRRCRHGHGCDCWKCTERGESAEE